jgi:predicted transposase/invertase (TIGR01784 family)
VVPGIDPTIDYAFKRLFGREQNRALLIHLLNAVLDPSPAARVISIEILNPFNEKDTLDDKLSVVDIKARDQSGRQYDIEMQLLADRYFRGRVLYYWAKFHQQQLHEAEDYLELHPTVLICFVNNLLFPEDPRHHLHFQVREVASAALFSDHLEIHLLELPKFDRTAEQLAEPLDQWLYFLRHAATLDSAGLPQTLVIPEIQKAMEELTMISRTDLERERYEARLRLERDERSRLRSAHEEGVEEGLEKGREKGLEQGLQKGLEQGLEKGLEKGLEQGLEKGDLVGRIHLAQSFIGRQLTPRTELLALSLPDLKRLAVQLEEEMRKRFVPGA